MKTSITNENEIKSEKILVKDIFSTMWFRVPEYQRPYIWSRDEVNELLDDLAFASKDKPTHEYFLGSLVFQSRRANPAVGQDFDENDLLDGQQRMTTLLMLFACLRDLATDDDAKKACQSAIYQKGNKFSNIPERSRLVFAIRQAVETFVDDFIRAVGGTNKEADLHKIAASCDDTSLQNMARAILEIRRYLRDPELGVQPEALLKFLLNNVLLIYVATQDLDDAFRMFTILNDRGVPLRNSDILKSMNLGELDKVAEKTHYAKLWEEAESALGEDFDRFLNYIRTILLKDKARLSLLQEFEDKIYEPKEKDKATGQRKSALLNKGKDTFQLVERYLKHYNTVRSGNNYDPMDGSFQFDNLFKVMLTGLPSTDWIPPLLRYFEKFNHDHLLQFLTLLDNKFSADWIGEYSPTDRIENMNKVIRAVEQGAAPDLVLADSALSIDCARLVQAVEGPVYGRRFARYLLLKLDYYFHDHAHKMVFETLSVEHILPQNPDATSQWKIDFNDQDASEWTHRLGNLVLITRTKNASQGRLDYSAKKKKYFEKAINTCPNSLRVLQNEAWTPVQLKANHKIVLDKIYEHYGVRSASSTA
jgi:uncharacterized protein with ParB-like and HNH nuclease domain